MNVYEESHKLAQAIKESDEYKQYIELQKKLDENPELAQKVKAIMEKQLEFQTKIMMEGNQNVDPNNIALPPELMKEITSLMMTEPLAGQYMQAQVRYSLMLGDVYKIIGEVAGIGNLL